MANTIKTNEQNIKNQIIKQKLNQNNDILLYIKTNIYYKPFLIQNNQYVQNWDSILMLYNKVNLLNQNTHKINISTFYKYITKLNTYWEGIVSVSVKDILAKNMTKIQIDNCNIILKKYRYYVEIVNNKYNKICIWSDNKINNVKNIELTHITQNTKIYPNILGIPPQVWNFNISIPLMFGVVIWMIVLWVYFFKKKYN